MPETEASSPPTVAVFPASDRDDVRQRALQLAEDLRLPMILESDPGFEILLTVTADRLELRFPGHAAPSPLYVDFVGGSLGYARRVNRSGLLFQAVGLRSGPPTVLDVTAGLGRDAFRLACHGCRVTAIERSPIVFALLLDGLQRGLADPEVSEMLSGRLQVLPGDARTLLRQMRPHDAPDVVYVDPMFPPRRKSALVKIEMRVLRRLIGDDPDASELLALARTVARRRVVVKRHAHAEPLAPDPVHSHRDKTTRYDVYRPSG